MTPHAPWRRPLLGAALLLTTVACTATVRSAPASGGGLTATDSLLVGRILLAEDRRDAGDAALGEGERHPAARVRLIARRARARIDDPKFAARDTVAPPREPAALPEPA
ncbi:MAG: hypothetical protein JWN79_1526, partial [Gemmatimonadetes bacterium]|nr:hypothetical protein [Gemmatimonadota bacterium]